MKWIKRIIGFIKLYNDYGYEPDTWRHIVETYQQVLCNRTKTMSKPTYYLKDILDQMDYWYADTFSRLNDIREEMKNDDRI